jgi:hypothetical protein
MCNSLHVVARVFAPPEFFHLLGNSGSTGVSAHLGPQPCRSLGFHSVPRFPYTKAKRKAHNIKIAMHRATTEIEKERVRPFINPTIETTIDPPPKRSQEIALILLTSIKCRPSARSNKIAPRRTPTSAAHSPRATLDNSRSCFAPIVFSFEGMRLSRRVSNSSQLGYRRNRGGHRILGG